MASDFRRRVAALERAQAVTIVISAEASDSALAKVTAFVDDNSGRLPNESWAAALARCEGLTTSQLMAALSDNGNSRYLVATTSGALEHVV